VPCFKLRGGGREFPKKKGNFRRQPRQFLRESSSFWKPQIKTPDAFRQSGPIRCSRHFFSTSYNPLSSSDALRQELRCSFGKISVTSSVCGHWKRRYSSFFLPSGLENWVSLNGGRLQRNIFRTRIHRETKKVSRNFKSRRNPAKKKIPCSFSGEGPKWANQGSCHSSAITVPTGGAVVNTH